MEWFDIKKVFPVKEGEYLVVLYDSQSGLKWVTTAIWCYKQIFASESPDQITYKKVWVFMRNSLEESRIVMWAYMPTYP